MSDGRNLADVYRECNWSYFYLYLSEKYSIAELNVKRDYNHENEVVSQENYLDVRTMSELNESILQRFKKATKVYTNLLADSILYKAIKKDVRNLRFKLETNFTLSYQNLIGGLYDTNTVVSDECWETIERLKKEVDFFEGKYPPEIISLAQLSDNLNRYCTAIDYTTVIKRIQRLDRFK